MNKPALYISSFALDVIILDQLTKWWITDHPQAVGHPGDFFQLVFTQNTGIAFSLPISGLLWYVLFGFLVVFGIPWARKHLDFSSPLTIAVCSLILGGAIGNLIDRVRLGAVVDFIKVGPWPLFNIADSAITVGIILFLIFQKKIVKAGSLQET